MSQFTNAPTRYFVPSAAIAQYARVVLASDGTISTAGATDQSIGVAEEAAYTTGLNPLRAIAVRMNTAQGTRKMLASATIAKGGICYGAATGKVNATNNGNVEGMCLDGAASGDVCEVMWTTGDQLAAGDVFGVATGYKIARGQTTTASASDTVVTGLATVVSVVATLESDPVLTCAQASAALGDQAGAPAAGSILVKTWMPTDSTHPLLIAATTFTKKVNWVAIGT